ncbi:MAG: VWA domain-containing protein [Flavobacteriales bacterium]
MISWLTHISYQNPEAFWGALLIPLLILLHFFRTKNRRPRIRFPGIGTFSRNFPSNWGWLHQLPFAFRMLGIALLITALARPTTSKSWKNMNTEGIDIILSMDVSASMLARDFDPNRLEAAKKVASEFISERPQDRIGLVIYEGESFTQCPLTTDHRVVQNLLGETGTGMLKGGTAIGMGLATAVNRLKESSAKSKVIILLTDGVNNRGAIAPVTAARLARDKGIRVYTIGVGSKGKALAPVRGRKKYRRVKVRIDEKTLKKVAKITNGAYFRATNNEKLKKIYQRIDKLEKSKIKVTEHSEKNEEYHAFLLGGVLLFLLDRLLIYSLLRSIP